MRPLLRHNLLSGPDREYIGQQPIRFQNENGDYGWWGQFLPVRKPIYYPPGGVIQLQVTNNGATSFTGLEAYFRGSKVFQPGRIPCLTYPPGNIATEPFILNGLVSQMAVTSQIQNNIIRAHPDADFIIRAINMGSWHVANQIQVGNQPLYINLYIQLKDATGKAYSNLPVHADVCFGSMGSILSPMTLGPQPIPVIASLMLACNRRSKLCRST